MSPWLNADTDLTIDHLAELPEEYYSANLPANYQCLNELIRRCLRAQEESYHAVIIGCSGDPGYREVKRLLRIPVVAPMTANLHIASLLRHSVAVLSPAPPGTHKANGWYKGIARSAGLE